MALRSSRHEGPQILSEGGRGVLHSKLGLTLNATDGSRAEGRFAVYKNNLKLKLQTGEPAMGCIVQGALPALVEIIGLAGFDFVFIDSEHGPLSVRDCEDLVRAAEVRHIVPVIRVPENKPGVILRHMDIGAMGIVMPHVDNKEEAQAAVRAVKYYPQGERGLASSKSSDYGMGRPRAEYVIEANNETMVFAIVESKEAIDNIEEILSVDGMDAVLIGTSDLSQSLGVPGQVNHPAVEAAFERVLSLGISLGKPIGATVRGGETAKQYFDRGVSIALTTAYSLFKGAAKSFVAAGR